MVTSFRATRRGDRSEGNCLGVDAIDQPVGFFLPGDQHPMMGLAGGGGGGAEAPASGIFHKTAMCKFHQRNMCRKGARCNFAHSREELHPLPDLRCTRFCPALLRTGTCMDPSCRFAHKKDELRKANVVLGPEAAVPAGGAFRQVNNGGCPAGSQQLMGLDAADSACEYAPGPAERYNLEKEAEMVRRALLPTGPLRCGPAPWPNVRADIALPPTSHRSAGGDFGAPGVDLAAPFRGDHPFTGDHRGTQKMHPGPRARQSLRFEQVVAKTASTPIHVFNACLEDFTKSNSVPSRTSRGYFDQTAVQHEQAELGNLLQAGWMWDDCLSKEASAASTQDLSCSRGFSATVSERSGGREEVNFVLVDEGGSGEEQVADLCVKNTFFNVMPQLPCLRKVASAPGLLSTLCEDDDSLDDEEFDTGDWARAVTEQAQASTMDRGTLA